MTTPSQGHGEGGSWRHAAALVIALCVLPSCAEQDAPRRSAPSDSAATPGETGPVATERGSPNVAGSDLTPDDHGRVVSLRVGESADLVLAAPVVAEPVTSGDAIELVATDAFAASEVRQWEVRANTPGTAVIEAQDARDTVRITVVVTRAAP